MNHDPEGKTATGGRATAALLRIASFLALVQFAAHTFMFLSAKPHHGPAELGVIEAMKGNRFVFAGSDRTYWDFYFGYGLFAAFNVFVEMVLFWQLASLADGDPARVKPLVGLFLFANLVYAALCANYFFIVPVVPDLAIALCLAGALVPGRRPSHQVPTD